MAQKRLIFHVDVNSAFLSWESARRVEAGEPDLRLIPACIGGDPKKRTGVVLAKSIPAKKYGVRTGESMAQAFRKCPMLISVPADFRLYDKCSRAFKEICQSYAPAMESFSIDEVFLDMTGTSLIYPDPVQTAHEIKNRIREELGFTVNIGIGENKLCAKMASDFEKPNKVHTLFPDEIKEKLWPLSVESLFSVGRATTVKLRSRKIETIGDLARVEPSTLQKLFGTKQGLQLYNYANGIDDSPVLAEPEEAKGYSAETTLEEDILSLEELNQILLAQADIVSARMRREKIKCTCVTVKYKTSDFKVRTHQRKLIDPTDVTAEIFEMAKVLMEESWKKEPVRLVGLSLTGLDHGEYEQLSFFHDEKKERLKKLDQTMDSIRNKYGNQMIQRASQLENKKTISRKYEAEHQNRVEDGDW